MLTASALAVSTLIGLCCVPEVGASEITQIGYLDQQKIEDTTGFRAANAQVAQEKTVLDAAFALAMRNAHSRAEQDQLNADFTKRFTLRQAAILGPMYQRARRIINEVAARRKLGVVLDRRVIIVGGIDVTPEVLTRLASPAPLAATIPALPHSTVGYIDQTVIAAVPKVAAANQATQLEQQHIESQAAADVRAAKTDAERAQIAQTAQTTQAAKEHERMDPIINQINDIIASVAGSENVSLVVDKSVVMIGGRDLTATLAERLK